MKTKAISVVARVSISEIGEILCALDPADIQEFIQTVDLYVGDAAFTKSLIKRLAKSLRDDFTSSEWVDFVSGLSKITAKKKSQVTG